MRDLTLVCWALLFPFVCWPLSLFPGCAEGSAYSLLSPNLSVAVIGWRDWMVDLQLPFHSISLFPGCYRLTCLRVWSASFNFIQLFHFVCTSHGFLLAEWRMKRLKEKKNSSNKMLLKCCVAQEHKLQPGTHYIFESKMIRLHNTMWRSG